MQLTKEALEKAIVAPYDKVIVRIEKGDNRLQYEISSVKTGSIVTAGDKVSESIRNAVNGHAVFGNLVAELPFETAGFGYLVMAEDNIHAVLKES
jgi:hypothetical protein